ncbi:MAG: T9SS type A sorting domain-containing protein [Bacteroidota bacterium]
MNKFLGLLFSVISFLPLTSKGDDILLYFSPEQVESHILLNFTISAGNTCNGIQIYRSTDSVNFEEIGDIQGICGSSDHNESYNFNDASPVKNKINYYRLQLGNLGYSNIIKIEFIDFSTTGFVLYPNPLNEHSKIYYANSSRETMSLQIFSASGSILFISENSGANGLEIPVEKLEQGIYFFTISSGSGNTIKYTGRFLVAD